jgi:hypothetical protein
VAQIVIICNRSVRNIPLYRFGERKIRLKSVAEFFREAVPVAALMREAVPVAALVREAVRLLR